MSNFDENRRVSFVTDEVSCRYLNIDLPLSLRSPSYTGKFGQQLKKIGIEKLPFGITLSDLILCGALVPSLYVVLPKEYFESWKNFPECPPQTDYDEVGQVGMYACQPMPQQATNLHDLLHPYDDGELKSSFKEKFLSEIPESFSICDHPSGAKYIPAETYLPYWQVYTLAGNFHKYRHAESFLSAEVGRDACVELIKSATKSFILKYGDTFDRVSWYKTIVAGATFCNLSVTSGQLLELAKNYTRVTIDLLEGDLQLLLELDANWNSNFKKYGCTVLENARASLSKDIYLIYDQLRLLGIPASRVFDNFTPDYSSPFYTPLHDVLQSEGYGFKKSFISLGSHYCVNFNKWGYNCTEEVFDSLIQISAFDSWIRAFHDLHESINAHNNPPVSFRQNRIVDALIVMSVRTEIVLREMFRAELSEKSDAPIESFLKAIKKNLVDEKQRVIDAVYSGDNSKFTKLHDRPSDIFIRIDSIDFSKWSKEDKLFFRAIMKFITARNYFAHHAYKDNELNIQTSTLSNQILESLLATLLFFQKNKKAGETTAQAWVTAIAR